MPEDREDVTFVPRRAKQARVVGSMGAQFRLGTDLGGVVSCLAWMWGTFSSGAQRVSSVHPGLGFARQVERWGQRRCENPGKTEVDVVVPKE